MFSFTKRYVWKVVSISNNRYVWKVVSISNNDFDNKIRMSCFQTRYKQTIMYAE